MRDNMQNNNLYSYTKAKVESLTKNLLVIKRDGRVVKFDAEKIYNAIEKAVHSVFGKNHSVNINGIVDNVILEIANRFKENIKIYELQNVVEHTLLTLGEEAIYEEYVGYRSMRDIEREHSLDINIAIEKLVNRDENVVNENANKDSLVFNTHRDLTSGIVAKAIGLKMLPKHVANAHQKGDIHYHDLDYSPYQPLTNCCLIDFKEMLTKGFKIGNADVDSPKSIQTATAQMAQIIANVASSQYGGCSADRIDEVLAPFAQLNYEKNLKMAQEWIDDEEKQKAFADKKTKKDIFDAMQSLEYEINTLYSSQGQTPFTSLGFGLGEGYFEKEIQKAILKVRIEGLGKEKRTAIFPKLIFVIKDGLNLKSTDPNYDVKQLALSCATQRMYPDVLMYDTITKITGSCKTPMGCRSFLPAWRNEQGELVESGRMNLGVVTLNLPRVALESKGDKEEFWNIFKERLENGETLDDILIEAFATVREASKRVLGLRHYDVQLIGGIVLHQGKITEMKTGEGKTLVATCPVYLNALAGKGVHVITVNDYLAKRDRDQMSRLYGFLGLSSGVILNGLPTEQRKRSYESDITYGTNSEFGFDYLRDNMVNTTEELVQRELNFAVVDEVDSVLIDDARTPLIISGPVPQGDRQEFDVLKPSVDRIVEVQKKTVSTIFNEAKKLIAQGNKKEGGFKLLQAYRGLPKNKHLIKFLSEDGNRVLLQNTEAQYMQDNNREMHVVDKGLYFVIDEKNNQIDLTDKGVDYMSQGNEDPNFFVLQDRYSKTWAECAILTLC